MTRTRSITRRRFLERAGLAAMAAPLVVKASALGADGGAPPSERINMAALGLGGRGRGVFGGMTSRSDAQAVAVCDVHKSRLDWGRDQGLAVYSDFRDLFARDDVDAVVITTPCQWRAIHAIAAAKAGIDVYCEKPMSLGIGDGRAMVDAVRRYGRVFQHGTQQRSQSEFRFACEMVRSGRIGELDFIEVNVGGPAGDCYLPAQPVPEGLDWDLWLGPAPWRPFNSRIYRGWEGWRDYSGGGMTGWGSHHFDIAQWGLAADHTGPVEIIPPDGKDVKLLTYKYANGVNVYHTGRMGEWAVVFHGSEGRIAVNRGKLQTWPESIMQKPTAADEVHLYRSPGEATSGHGADFLRSVRTRQKPAADVEIGHRTMSVAHLGNIAYLLRRPLKWDPALEQFLGDPQANRLLDRPRRGPWTLS